MPPYLLYQFPGSCSRVALNALEEIGLPYQDKGVSLTRGEHRQPDYLAMNFKGKVPTLLEDGRLITELPVMLYRLSHVFPDAGLLPGSGNDERALTGLSDLIWMAGTLHPFATQMFRPFVVSEIDTQGVKSRAIAGLAEHARTISARLTDQDWWYGEQWSIADVFLAWIFGIGGQCNFPISDFPALVAHRQRVEARPSYGRALARERAAVTRDDLLLVPGISV
jgi:glutathione S-transferase